MATKPVIENVSVRYSKKLLQHAEDNYARLQRQLAEMAKTKRARQKKVFQETAINYLQFMESIGFPIKNEVLLFGSAIIASEKLSDKKTCKEFSVLCSEAMDRYYEKEALKDGAAEEADE